VTPTAAELIAALEHRVHSMAEKERSAPDAYSRGLYAGWGQATMAALRMCRTSLKKIEYEAGVLRLPAETVQRLIAEEWRQ
jgi:hypothetical protein